MTLSALISRWGLPLVFANVLVEQLGLPVPAVPTLVVAGALAAQGELSLAAVVFVSVLAAVLADSAWFQLGRRHGARILNTLCRMSLSPQSCVTQTEERFARWGLRSLLFAKFVPGYSTLAPPLAGTSGAGFLPFLAADAAGGLLWAGSAVAAGVLFHDAVDRVLDQLAALGSRAIPVLIGLALLFVASKWAQRRRFYRVLRMARIEPAELRRLMEEGPAPLIVDVRNPAARKRDPRRIPGAIQLDIAHLEDVIPELSTEREVVLYCT